MFWLTIMALLLSFNISFLYAAHDVDTVIYRRLKKVEKNIPLEPTADVVQSIRVRMYQNRSESQELLTLSDWYLPIIEKELWNRHLPTELKYLPLSLSSFSTQNISADGGAGYWDLQYFTAIRYGLKISYWIDERMDLKKSTLAAILYIEHLHTLYADWGLTILAFLSSPAELNTAILRNKGERSFPFIIELMPSQVRKRYASFVSAVYLLNYYNEYDLSKKKLAPTPDLSSVACQQAITFENLAKYLEISLKDLYQWNPVFIRGIIPANPLYLIRIPNTLVEKYKTYKEASDTTMLIKQTDQATTTTEVTRPINTTYSETKTPTSIKTIKHRILKGETLGKIALKYHVSVDEIKKWNQLKSDLIYVGQQLTIHDKSAEKYTDCEDNTNTSTKEPANTIPTKTEWVYYTVQTGDSIWRIANKYGISEADLIKNNDIKNNLIYPGQRLKIKRK
ncbi:MAG: LysM peptidoglycan-binding domain-containing protein [Flavobacteriales bacterium]|nr:LysM peptidoglycan-binding domain-containing protein [Flavobacteriales bacterium]